jgi:hypothetical protein
MAAKEPVISPVRLESIAAVQQSAVAGQVSIGVGGASEQKTDLRMAGAPSLMAVTVHRLFFRVFGPAGPLSVIV